MPRAYMNLKYQRYSNQINDKYPYDCKSTTIKRIVGNYEYCGHMVSNRNTKHLIKNDESNWIIVKITPYCSHEGNSCNVEFSIKVNLYYSDGITIYKDYFNPNIKGIQTKLILVSLKDEENSVIVPSKVELVVDYSNNNGNCILDNVRLINGNYRYIKYDKAYNKVYEYYSQSNRPYSLNKKKRIKEEVYYTYNHNEQISNASKLELHIDGDEIYENITNIDYKYNSDNKLISSSDNKGNIVEYKYHDKYIQLLKYNKDNINDRLKEITSPTGNVIYETTIDNTTVLHCEPEYSSPVHCKDGAIVMLNAVLKADKE